MGLPNDSRVKLRNKYPKGTKNKITDVPGVSVGHTTLQDEEKSIHTGVTAVLPHGGNLFREKVAAGVSVINGFGKSAGLIQIEEMGVIESPILMTNTFGVGTALNAAVKYMLEGNGDIGVTSCTVNCVITECNDGALNDIRGMYISEKDVLAAIGCAGESFDEGDVGGGTGMCCMGLKGGIGSASRIVNVNGGDYVLGTILMSNFGLPGNLRIDGKPVSTLFDIAKGIGEEDKRDRGSVIIIMATDIPLSSRQLKRVANRAVVGLSRAGSYLGNGSGDIAVAFSTANKIPHYSDAEVIETKIIHEDCLETIFEASAEVVEEAIISSLYHAKTVKGIRGKIAYGLLDVI